MVINKHDRLNWKMREQSNIKEGKDWEFDSKIAEKFKHPQLKEGQYYFQSESEAHEATWLMWPPQNYPRYEKLHENWV